ncbi:hypothetical protein [Ferruginibacter albus]|uniref:hypothetical protein n=1 Tax=Ferruginibacter albus TaxID=2875540 RepID=UPI001CC487AE|nr:hypothetical protein [Ferruginibacter albus]UAY52882.1 hypothetical protein K9M53_04185 [Ferruginibacter albus]
MKFYSFTYVDIYGQEILNSGEAYYYTTAEKNIDEMKNAAREILKMPSAVITIHKVQEISKELYETRIGKNMLV